MECRGIILCDDSFQQWTVAARRQGSRGQNIQEAVHRESGRSIHMAYGMMQSRGRFERHVRRSGGNEKLHDFIHAGKGLRRQSCLLYTSRCV